MSKIVPWIALVVTLIGFAYTVSEQRYRAGYMQGSMDGIQLAVSRLALPS